MKILHVATLVTPDGAFGGPVRVAVNQVRALREAGHDAILIAGQSGFGDVPKRYDGVPVKLFPVVQVIPGAGFPGLTSPRMLRWLKKVLPTVDVVHFHLARDLVTLPAADLARRLHVPYVVQSHGMIVPSANPFAKPLDAALTRRVLRGASTRFVLNAKEGAGVAAVVGTDIELELLPNGVAEPPKFSHERSEGLDVLFLARLHPRKRPEFFVETAAALRARHPGATFSIVGPDEGSLATIEHIIRERGATNVRIEGALAPELTLARMSRCDVYVLPSIDEPFGMSVLEAMSLGKPVVVTDSCGLAPVISVGGCGIVVDATQDRLTEAVASLLANTSHREELAAKAASLARTEFSMGAVVKRLEVSYAKSRGPKRRQLWIVQPYVPSYRIPFFEMLMAALAEDGIDLHVVAGLPDESQAKRGDATSPSWLARVAPFEFKLGRRRIALTNTRKYWASADAVIVPHMGSSLDAYLALLGRGRNRRRVGVWGHIASYVGPANPVDMALEAWQLRASDHVFAYMPGGAAYAKDRLVPPARITTVMNSMDTAALRKAIVSTTPALAEAFRAQHDLDPAKTFSYIGGLDASKRVHLLAATLDEIWARDTTIKLLVGGRGEDEHLLDRAAERGQVVRLGYVTAPDKALMAKNSQALLSPGRIGLVAVESIILNLPIISVAWPFHAPEVEYLQPGSSLIFGGDSPVSLAREVLGFHRSEHQLQSNIGEPSIETMVTNFRQGILSMMSMRP